MTTKIELECNLLMVEHDIRYNLNNERAFAFRATMGDKRAELCANYYKGCKTDAMKEAANLRAAISAA